VFVDRFHRLDWDLQIARVRATVQRYNNAMIAADTTGAGEPVYEAMLRAGCAVHPYVFSTKSKADLINNLAMLLEHRTIVLPRPELWPEGIDELEAFEYSITDAGSVRTSAPSGQHDDCVVSLALAAWQTSRFAGQPLLAFIDGNGGMEIVRRK